MSAITCGPAKSHCLLELKAWQEKDQKEELQYAVILNLNKYTYGLESFASTFQESVKLLLLGEQRAPLIYEVNDTTLAGVVV